MATAATLAEADAALRRPYTINTFQQRLQDFEQLIKEITLQGVEGTPEERRQRIADTLRYDSFCDSIRALFGTDINNQDLKALFRKIQSNPDAKVDWSELFGYLQSGAPDLTSSEEQNVFSVTARRRVGEASGGGRRRDTVQCLRYVPQLDGYLSATQKGAINIWTAKLRLAAAVDIQETTWVTGCDYLPGIRRVAICTERSINIWDNRAKGKTQAVFSIKPIKHPPQCVCWVPAVAGSLEDTLLFGDDQGYLNLLCLQAKDLTMKNSKASADPKRFTQNYAIEPEKLSTPIMRKKIHTDWVLTIKYLPTLRCIVTCSANSHRSLMLEEVDKVFSVENTDELRFAHVPRGVNAVEYSEKANIIATGGVDKIIRVWHPHIFSRPTGKLLGHLFTIVAISINEKDAHIISLSAARVFRIWDIHTLTCLQVFTDNEERQGEKRIAAALFCNRHDFLLTGSSVLDVWPLTRTIQDTMSVPQTHDRGLSQILFNRELNQLLSVCQAGHLKVWEAESGRMVWSVTDAHGEGVEVTAVALDRTGYRLVTGAVDGSLRVYDFGSGQDMKRRDGRGGEGEFAILGLAYVNSPAGERWIIVAGWGNKLKLLSDSNTTNELIYLREFNDSHYINRQVSPNPLDQRDEPLPDIGQGHMQVDPTLKRERLLTNYDITCSILLDESVMKGPTVFATGTHTGDIIVWNVQKTDVETIFMMPPASDSQDSVATRRQSNAEKRVARATTALLLLQHRARRIDPQYLKSLERHHSYIDSEADDLSRSPNRSKRPSRMTLSSRVTQPRTPSTRSAHTLIVDKSLLETKEESLRNAKSEKRVEVVPEPSEKMEEIGKIDADENALIEARTANTSSMRQSQQETEIDDRRSRKSVHMENVVKEEKEDDEEEKEDDHMIVDEYTPLLVSSHRDAKLRFWSLEGDLVKEAAAVTRRQGVPLTALACDFDAHLLVSGDQKGYLTLWDTAEFLQSGPDYEGELRQVISWRAHLTKIVQLAYADVTNGIISASADGSVRVWWGQKGRFVGYFGQHRVFNFPKSEETAPTPILPYDITEGPLAPVKPMSGRQKMQKQRFQYPLNFDNNRWEPYNKSANARKRIAVTNGEAATDKKFFSALIKPSPGAANKVKLSHMANSGDLGQGSAFRSLPVYRVTTPPIIKAPDWFETTRHKPTMEGVVKSVKALTRFPKEGEKAR